MFIYLKWYIKKIAQSGFETSSGLAERRTEIAKLIAEIDMITDRDSQLVEDRIIKLKAIIEDTDKRIAVYLKELEKSRNTETLYTSLGRGIREALETPAEETKPVLVQDTIELSDDVQTTRLMETPVHPSFESIMEISAQEESAVEETPSPPPSRQQIRTHIDLLLNEGLPPEKVASRLGISIAEVNLAMNLRRR